MGLFSNKKDAKGNDPLNIAPVLPQEIYEAGILELRDIIAPSALELNSKDIKIGEKLARTFFVMSYPRFLAGNWFSPVINLDKMFDIAIHVHPVETAEVLRALQKKVAEVQSQIHMREDRGMVRDPKLDTAYQDIEQLRDRLQQSQEKLFDVGLYVTIYGDTEEELTRVEVEVKGILEAKLVYLKPALFQQEEGFRSVMPLGRDELQVNNKLNSAPLSSMFPFVSFDLTSDRGILYGINRHNASLVLFDRFSLENYNSIVFAKSGSGKSLEKNSPVLVRRNGKVELRPIGKLVDEAIRENGSTKIDEEIEGVIDPNMEVWSFDANLRGSWSKVTIAARKDAPETFYRFCTKSGREITTTGDHNMLVLRDGRVVVAKSTDIKEGEVVPLPRKVENSNTKTSINLIKLFAESKERIYVSGAEKVLRSHAHVLDKAIIDPKFDKYLYKYKTGRRIPIKYFLKILRLIGEDKNSNLSKLKIMSASGKESLPAELPVTLALGNLLGYIASEGTINKQAVIISNTDKEVLDICESSFREIAVSSYSIDRALATASRPFVHFIYAIGANGYSAEKHVPGIIFSAPIDVQKAFLSSYFEGDGGVDGVQVTATSKSKDLLSGIAYLLLNFGIVARLRQKNVQYGETRERRVFWTLSIAGQENLRTFRDEVGFATKHKQKALAELCTKEGNTNVDTIPEVANLLTKLREAFGSQMHNIANLSPISRGIYAPSPQELTRLVKAIEERVLNFKKIAPAMRAMSSLPLTEELVKMGETNKQFNARLWEELGSSWAWIKNRKGEVGVANVITIAKVVLGAVESATIEASIARVHSSFLDFDASIKSRGVALSAAFRKGVPDRTSYEMIRGAASFITETYTNISANLPRIEGILSLLKRLAGADLVWDPIVSIEKIANKEDSYVYDLEVGNEIFLAGTAGLFVHNSYLTKLEILRTLMFDADVIVIDPEREYEFLANATGGRYFNISLTSEHHINPFDLPFVREDESPADVLRSNIITLVGLFRIMLGGLSPEEDAIIDRAITETYALKDITPDRDFSGAEPPLLSDLELVLAGMEGGESLAQRLLKYTRGTWAGFLNQPTNVDINKKFVVFSVRDMEDELKPVAMHITMNYIWNAIRHDLKKRLLVIDEAWWMMKSDDTASFVFSLAKRGRKYFLGLATITQDVGDFLKSPYGLPIITNSSIQILMKQSTATIDMVQQTFNLTDEEKFLLLESDVGEGIFFAGLKHVAIKVIASYTEDQIITSDPSQLLAIKKAKEERKQAMEGAGLSQNEAIISATTS